MGLNYYQISEDSSLVHQLIQALYQLGISSVLIEGGARLLQSFIDENCWDEARVIQNTGMMAGKGLPAPQLHGAISKSEEMLGEDRISFYVRQTKT